MLGQKGRGDPWLKLAGARTTVALAKIAGTQTGERRTTQIKFREGATAGGAIGAREIGGPDLWPTDAFGQRHADVSQLGFLELFGVAFQLLKDVMRLFRDIKMWRAFPRKRDF